MFSCFYRDRLGSVNKRISAKVVSEQLGHATVAFTLDVYTHVLPHMPAKRLSWRCSFRQIFPTDIRRGCI